MQVEIAHRFSADLDEVALNSPEATFYHTGTWIESLSLAYPAIRFQCLIARSGAETLGFLPYFILKKGPVRALWSMPFGTYGGAVTLGDEAVHRLLLDTYVRMRRHAGVHEMGVVDFHNRISGGLFRMEDAATHLETATTNGFAFSVVNAPLIIADGLTERRHQCRYAAYSAGQDGQMAGILRFAARQLSLLI